MRQAWTSSINKDVRLYQVMRNIHLAEGEIMTTIDVPQPGLALPVPFNSMFECFEYTFR